MKSGITILLVTLITICPFNEGKTHAGETGEKENGDPGMEAMRIACKTSFGIGGDMCPTCPPCTQEKCKTTDEPKSEGTVPEGTGLTPAQWRLVRHHLGLASARATEHNREVALKEALEAVKILAGDEVSAYVRVNVETKTVAVGSGLVASNGEHSMKLGWTANGLKEILVKDEIQKLPTIFIGNNDTLTELKKAETTDNWGTHLVGAAPLGYKIPIRSVSHKITGMKKCGSREMTGIVNMIIAELEKLGEDRILLIEARFYCPAQYPVAIQIAEGRIGSVNMGVAKDIIQVETLAESAQDGKLTVKKGEKTVTMIEETIKKTAGFQ